ncbi:hypothetical protein E3E23_00645 [Thermococcus sp. CX2]|uniref:hypothetical protein n=1 Tax=Thermococcus sp. CX2 TaxID=163006 RepID=UPI00143902AA|nr:hypothetical protein [Thermococcus sp. CX2]NJE84355.1 hypothetical protein [Thermococcus sp. CX2]
MGDTKGLKLGQWGLKTALASAFLGALLWYGAEKSVTVAQINVALASVPLAFVALIEIFDKVADKNDYYNKLYATFGAKKSRAGAILTSLLFAALGMFVVIWALTGTITMNIGTIGPENIFVAGLISLYIFAPETGDDELLLWTWIGATIATKGQYLVLVPQMWGFDLSMLVRTLIPAL